MNAQSVNNPDKQDQLTLELLQAIEEKDDISQRHLAQQMGVALGLANSYLKRCVKKGWIKITTAPANRYLYYLTANGFAEKTRLMAEFLSTSLTLFRQSGDTYSQLFDECLQRGATRVLFAGLSDLTEIAYMRSLQSEIEVVGVYQPEASKALFFELPVVAELGDCEFDVIIMTSMEQTAELVPQLTELLAQSDSQQQLIVPEFLMSMHYRT